MKRTTTHVARLTAGLFLLITCVRGAPLPVENPNTPQQQAPVSPPETNGGTLSPGRPGAPGSNGRANARNTTEGRDAYGEKALIEQDRFTGAWGGWRTKLEDDGLKFTPTYIGEFFGNPSGGTRHGMIYEGLLNLPLDFNLDRMSGGALEDTTFHVNALEIHGPSLSAHYVGDFSDTSNIAAYNTLRLQELWLQKWFWEKRISVKVGNMAVDAEFFQSASASLFINGTFGTFTFVANNLPSSPVYPLASPGVRLQFLPDSAFYIMAGVYGQDLDSDPALNDHNGTRFALSSSDGVLIMSEAGYLLNQSPNDRGLAGTYRRGSFVHTNDTLTFTREYAGTDYGVYGVMDQKIYSRDDGVISFFVRSGGAPSNTNFVDYYVEGGFNFGGFIPGRDSDVFGLAVARSHVSAEFSSADRAAGHPGSNAETVIEATYKARLAPWWSVQPDVQYIISPSGIAGTQNALVLGLRTTVAF